MLEIYFDDIYDLFDAKRTKMDPKYEPINLILNAYDFEELYKEKLGDSTVKGDEKIRWFTITRK